VKSEIAYRIPTSITGWANIIPLNSFSVQIIKVCNVIKNEKAAKAKLQSKKKGQAQKSKKIDKAAEKKAKKMSEDLFGDNDQYDNVDDYGANYEDSFF